MSNIRSIYISGTNYSRASELLREIGSKCADPEGNFLTGWWGGLFANYMSRLKGFPLANFPYKGPLHPSLLGLWIQSSGPILGETSPNDFFIPLREYSNSGYEKVYMVMTFKISKHELLRKL